MTRPHGTNPRFEPCPRGGGMFNTGHDHCSCDSEDYDLANFFEIIWAPRIVEKGTFGELGAEIEIHRTVFVIFQIVIAAEGEALPLGSYHIGRWQGINRTKGL